MHNGKSISHLDVNAKKNANGSVHLQGKLQMLWNLICSLSLLQESKNTIFYSLQAFLCMQAKRVIPPVYKCVDDMIFPPWDKKPPPPSKTSTAPGDGHFSWVQDVHTSFMMWVRAVNVLNTYCCKPLSYSSPCTTNSKHTYIVVVLLGNRLT